MAEPLNLWFIFHEWLFPDVQVVGAVCTHSDEGFQIHAWLHRCVPVQKGAANDAN